MRGRDGWEAGAVAKISSHHRLPVVCAGCLVVSGGRHGGAGVEDRHAGLRVFGVGEVGCGVKEVRTVGWAAGYLVSGFYKVNFACLGWCIAIVFGVCGIFAFEIGVAGVEYPAS